MKNSNVGKPEIQPVKRPEPVKPLPPEIIPVPDQPRPNAPIPETEPLRGPEIRPVKK